MNPTIQIKRIYEEPKKPDGHRILVDRLWPRGLTKAAAAVEDWEKELAPTTELRTWFGHKPELWKEFQKRYKAELQNNTHVETFLNKYKAFNTLTLLYANKDEEHSHALVLRDYLLHSFSKMK